jgi:alpha-tubulin suppressor-like RCC1 family protein
VLNATIAVLAAGATSALGVGPTTPAGASSTSSLYGWGLNSNYQLGDGSTTNAVSPELITLPSWVTPIAGAVGGDHTLIIGSDENLYAWGYNAYGQLGIGTVGAQSAPVTVSMPAGVTPLSVAAGNDHSLAIGSDGTVYAWGYNAFGQLGNGTTTDSHVPIAVSLPAGVSANAIAAGAFFSMALGSDGNVYTWGDGANGALGNGGTANEETPVEVPLPAGVTATAIAAERYSALVIGSNGVLYAWGRNSHGELGNGGTSEADSPVTVSTPDGVTASAIAGGGRHALMIGSDGNLYAWGYNAYGQVGNETTTVQPTPVQVALPSGVEPVAIAGGMNSSYTIGSDGNLYAWGYNGDGELGNGGTINSETLAPVSLPALSLPATGVFSGSSSETGFAVATTTTTTTQSGNCTAGFDQPCMAVPPGYNSSQMVLDETFPGPGLDSDWSDVTGGPAPIGSWSTAPCCNQPTVSDGLTVDNTKSTNADTSNPETGQVLFQFPSAFYLQVRFKVSDMSQGFFPAIWMPFDDFNTQPNEPVNGNDINPFEGGELGDTPALGAAGNCTSVTTANDCVEANYGSADPAIGNSEQFFYNVGYDITQNFVTLGVEVEPGNHVSFYYNGTLIGSDTNGSTIGSDPNYNLQITPQLPFCTCGWHTNGSGTGSVEVSEVQVYSAP